MPAEGILVDSNVHFDFYEKKVLAPTLAPKCQEKLYRCLSKDGSAGPLK